jgi:hypothetical protein
MLTLPGSDGPVDLSRRERAHERRLTPKFDGGLGRCMVQANSIEPADVKGVARRLWRPESKER